MFLYNDVANLALNNLRENETRHMITLRVSHKKHFLCHTANDNLI